MPREVFVTMRLVLNDGVNELYKAYESAAKLKLIEGVRFCRVVKFMRGDKLNKQANDDDYDD